MSYETKTHSPRSSLALGLALVAIGLVLVLVGLLHVQTRRLVEVEELFRKQHDEITALRTRTDRLDEVLSRALDAAAIARAVLEESEPK